MKRGLEQGVREVGRGRQRVAQRARGRVQPAGAAQAGAAAKREVRTRPRRDGRGGGGRVVPFRRKPRLLHRGGVRLRRRVVVLLCRVRLRCARHARRLRERRLRRRGFHDDERASRRRRRVAVERAVDQVVVPALLPRQLREHVLAQHRDELPGELVVLIVRRALRLRGTLHARLTRRRPERRLRVFVRLRVCPALVPLPPVPEPAARVRRRRARRADVRPPLTRGRNQRVVEQRDAIVPRGVHEHPLHRVRLARGLRERQRVPGRRVEVQQRKLFPLRCRRQALGERLRPRVQAVHGRVLASTDEESHSGVAHARVPCRTAASPAAPPAEGRHRPGTDQPARRVRRSDRARQEQRHAQKGVADAHCRAAAPRRAADRAAGRRRPGSARPRLDRGRGRATPRSATL